MNIKTDDQIMVEALMLRIKQSLANEQVAKKQLQEAYKHIEELHIVDKLIPQGNTSQNNDTELLEEANNEIKRLKDVNNRLAIENSNFSNIFNKDQDTIKEQKLQIEELQLKLKDKSDLKEVMDHIGKDIEKEKGSQRYPNGRGTYKKRGE